MTPDPPQQPRPAAAPALEQRARTFLAQQLGSRAPDTLRPAGEFDERPLDGEGAVSIFSFDLPAGPGVAETGAPYDPAHYVVVGETEPSFFPAYGLSPDEAYSLHLGRRFMLIVGVAVADAEREPPQAREGLRAFVAGTNPEVPIEREELAGLFTYEEQLLAVYRVTLRGKNVYCLGADCPPGFYELTQYPPQVALALHLGQLIRAEAREEAARDDQMAAARRERADE